MSLEINKKGLSGKAIRVLENAMKEADVNKDGKVNGEDEISIFNKHIKNSPSLTKGEMKQILGEKKVKEDSEAKQERQEKRADKKDEKSTKNFFNETLETVVKGGVGRKDVVNALKEELTPEGTDAETVAKYNYLIEIVEKALAKVTIDDINKVSMAQIDTYIENMVANTKDATERKVLRQVGEMLKNEKNHAAKDDIANRYATKVAEAEEKGLKVTDKEIMDEILKELKSEGKYEEYDQNGEYVENAYVNAYKAFNKGEIARNARILLASVINGKTNPEEVEGSKIHKEAKQWLKDAGLWDSNVKKANRKQRFGRKASNYEGLERNVALNTIKSEDELKKAFGKNADEKIRALMNAQVNLTDEKGQPITDEEGEPAMFNLITKREDGYYDLTNLSRFIRQQVGVDLTYNKHKHDVNGEGGYLKRGLNGAITGDKYDLSNKEILDLVETCGYDKKGQVYSWLKGLLGAAGGALAHGATAGLATWTNEYQTYLDAPPEIPDIEVTDIVNIKEVIKEAGLEVVIDINQEITTVIKDIMADEETFLVVMPKLIAQNAVKSAVMGGVLGLLAGFQEVEEKPAVPLKVEQTTIKEYNDALKAGKETKKYAPLLTSLAMLKGYVSEDGTLDGPGFETYLQRVFAGNDILNKDEFAALEYEYLELQKHRLTTEKPEKEEEQDPVTPPPAPKEMEGSKADGKYNYTEEHDILVVNGIKSSWAEIANMYNDCIVPSRDAIDKNMYPNCYKRYNELEIRFVKVAQAINNGDYSLAHLLELAEATFAAKTSKYTELKERTDIDHAALLSAMNSDWLKDVKVPKKLGECTRVKDTPDDVKDMNTEGAKNAPTGYAKDTEKSYHQKDVYGLQMGNGEIEVFDDMQARDKRYAELVKQNQDAGYTVTTVKKLTPQEVEDTYKRKLEN